MALHIKQNSVFLQANKPHIDQKLELEIGQLNDPLTVLATVSAGCLHLSKQSRKSLWVRCEPTQWQPSWKQRCWASAASENSCCEREAALRSTHPALPLYSHLLSAFHTYTWMVDLSSSIPSQAALPENL